MRENYKPKFIFILVVFLGAIYISLPSLGVFPYVEDVDRNGILTTEDFRNYHRQRLSSDAAFMQKYDADKSGGLSDSEWNTAFTAENARLGLESDPRGIRNLFYEKTVNLGLDLQGGIDLVYEVVPPAELTDSSQRNALLRKTIEVLKNRIDMLKITEPVVQRYDETHIRVQLAGNFDESQVKAIMGQTDLLKFQELVDEKASPVQFGADGQNPAYEIVRGVQPVGKDGQPTGEPSWYLLKREVPLTGEHIDSAFVRFSEMGRPEIGLRFDGDGAGVFGNLTRGMVGRRLAIVLGGEVYMAPNIEEPITSGECTIKGSFDVNYVRGIVDVLKAGSLPAKLVLAHENRVGPSLGKDSVERGLTSGRIGMGLVFVIMLLWYRGAGIVSCITLGMNMILLLSVLVGLNATLTLPGIAGLVLTVGMAVDANVLIFERIKEEIILGKSTLAAIDAGFDKAMSAIVDSNLTTVLTCLILFNFGSGPLQGFAVTLIIGIMTSMFTAIFVTRVLMGIFYSRTEASKLSI